MNVDPRFTYARAAAGYDAEHEQQLLAAITTAIVETSRVSDANVVALRTGEIASALLTALAGTLAMSPAVTRSPTAMRKTVDQIGKRLRRRVAAAEHDPALAEFLRHVFRGTDSAGRA